MKFRPTFFLGALPPALVAATALLVAPAFAAEGKAARKEAPAAAAAGNKAAQPKGTSAAVQPKGKSAAAQPNDKSAAAQPKAKTAAAQPRPKATATAKKGKAAGPAAQAATKAPALQAAGTLADFGKVEAPAPVVHLANWASWTRNHRNKAFVVIDKQAAQMYVFDPRGKLKSSTTVLLGKAIGDQTAPGVGNKPMSQIQEHEKTTPAGRFLASPGRNTSGEDIIWIDYDAAVSLHRLRKVGQERRAERLASPDIADNRISNGCVNVPPRFYDTVLKPTVLKQGAYVYVLPETRTPQQLFGSFDLPPDAARRVQVAMQEKARR